MENDLEEASWDEKILSYLLGHPEGAHPSQIAEDPSVNCSITTASRHCAIMEARGVLSVQKVGNSLLYKVVKRDG